MMSKISTPIWQRVICGLLSVGGAVALVANALDGSIHDSGGVLVWLLGIAGAAMFGLFAVHKDAVYRDVDAMPVPSPQVSHLIDERRQLEAVKAYRAEAAASLFEAKAVIEHYWPGHSSKRAKKTHHAD